jgi:hypothetical protein
MAISHQHYIHLKTGKRYKTHGLFTTNCSVRTPVGWSTSKQYNANELENKALFKPVPTIQKGK